MSKRELIDIQTPNKDILTSFVYAWSRQKEMSLIEQRVVLRIIERASNAINGIKLKDNMRKLDVGLRNVTITMPVQDVMLNTKRRHADIEKALYNLRSRTFEYRENGRYTVCGFINNATYTYGSGEIKVEVDNKIWEVLLDFTSGYHRFELNKALALPTTYSLQFYMAMSGQNQPRHMTIEQLKDWLAIPQDSYKTDGKDRIDHLEARVLKPVKKVLDKLCPFSFTYEKVRQNPMNKKSPVVGFILRSQYLPKNRDPELEIRDADGFADFLQATVDVVVEFRCQIHIHGVHAHQTEREDKAVASHLDSAARSCIVMVTLQDVLQLQ